MLTDQGQAGAPELAPPPGGQPSHPPARDALARDLLDSTETGLVALDDQGRIMLANAAAGQLLGLPDLAMMVPVGFDAAHLAPVDQARLLDPAAGADGPLRLVTTQGLALSVRRRDTSAGILLSFTPAPPATPQPAIPQPATPELAEAQIDDLTGLIGRQRFDEGLAAMCGDGRDVAVLMIDLDRFKIVNDTLGHAAGDALLRTVATRLRATLRGADVISRFGGDEFAVALPATADIAAIAERIVSMLSRPYLVDRQVATIGASVGFAMSPVHGTTPAELLRAADLALHQAKAEGCGRARQFDIELDQRTRLRNALADELRRAVPLGQLLLHFQPQICLATGTLTGFEALVRWNHPTRGMIPPDQFIPLAEELNLIKGIGEWVMREACRQAMTWPSDVSVAVNVSPKQLLDGARLPTVIKAILAATGLPPARLEIEITETALMQEAQALDLLQSIRALGVKISLDDFGTGYSSLSQLRRFPFDKLKIDRSFVRELGSSQEAAGVVRAISALGQSLGMTTIAEGVETADQEAICRADGCTVMQGYLVSRPVPADEVTDLVLRLSRDTKVNIDV